MWVLMWFLEIYGSYLIVIDCVTFDIGRKKKTQLLEWLINWSKASDLLNLIF